MAAFNRQHSNLSLSEDNHMNPNPQMSARAKPSRKKMNHDDDGGGKEKQRRRGLGVAQLERLRLGSAAPRPSSSSSLPGPYFYHDLASVSNGGPAPLAPRYAGAFSAGSGRFIPTPAPFLAPEDDIHFSKELSDQCRLCHQKNLTFVAGQNQFVYNGGREMNGEIHSSSIVPNSGFVGSNVNGNVIQNSNGKRSLTPIFPKHAGSHFSYMHQGNELDAANGLKKGRFIEYYDFFPPCEKGREMAAQEFANQNGFTMTMKRNAPDCDLVFAASEMVGGGADTSCVTTSTSTGGGSGGGGGGGGAIGSIDLSLRLSNY